MNEKLVWLPFDAALLDTVPDGLRIETVDPAVRVPESVADVAFYVPHYRFGSDPAQAARDAAADLAVVERMESLEVFQALTAGTEHLAPHLPEHVRLCNARGVHDTATAELAVGLAIASVSRFREFGESQRRGLWEPLWRDSLAGSRVLVIGAGSIARAIEDRLAPFEAQTTLVGRTAREGVRAVAELPDLLPDADVVILIAPATDETRGMVDAAFLARLKPGAVLVNVARGALLETDALVAALHEGRLRAALDVTDPEPLPEGHPLWAAPNVVITPHVGGAASAMWPRAYALVSAQLARFVAGEPLANLVGPRS